MAELTSHGHVIDTGPDSYGPLKDSSELAEDPPALRCQMEEDGYLFLPGLLDREAVLEARRELLDRLVTAGVIDASKPLMDAIFTGSGEHLWDKQVRLDLRKGPLLKAVVHDGNMMAFYERFLGGKPLSLDNIWVRTVNVGGATGSHYDWVYMGRGTRGLYTSWTPIGDVPREEGALMILENSHRLDELISTYGSGEGPREQYEGGWYSKDPLEVQAEFGGRWLTTDFKAGDLLVFTMWTLHCSLDNQSPVNRMRLTTDTRYQLASEPVDQRFMGV